ncbi:GNAT family N-acetyltransferase [Nitratireductor basaltis]|uniref:GCN5-related N-acetyltransferase n=1 Tax=Nitratireductor basaltis TaxID=472175 RepID=A0A084U7N3_9HYPH|nr:GNAT family N-acetyltransferase [Nitratireductor basaltis]KFB08969.1 GCN5-related N-acetyltransferase [Nitratireductor basaltis]
MIRRFEAAGFRAWPANKVRFDGTWAIRMTASHPARRLNSVNPLDPGDAKQISDRVERARRLFEAYGRTPTFRISPLAASAISEYLDDRGWQKGGHSVVMRMPLTDGTVSSAMNQIPLKDLHRFVSAALRVHDYGQELRPGFTEVVSAIKAEAGFFVLEEGARSLATAICVHDGALAGLFEVATASGERGKGYGRRTILSALKWARLRGASTAWLQVELDNLPALKLYERLGFAEAYRYHYRQPPEH